MMTRLAVVSTHPIQYNAPLFRRLAHESGLELRVLYSWEGTAKQPDPGFGRAITWDIPLLDGYEYEFVANRSSDPGTHHFGGLNNPQMIPRIEAFKPDVVMVYGWAWRTHLAVLRHFKGRVPVFLRGDSTLLSGTGPIWKRWLRKPALRWIYSHVDVALSPGTRNREYLAAAGVGPKRIAFMPHSVDIEKFADESLQPGAEAERAKLGIAADEIVIGFAGKFVPGKQCGLLIDAFRMARERTGKPMHLLLIGEGPLRGELEAKAAADADIHFLGFRNQQGMPTAYRMADVIALPSTFESWGLSLNEAMASGRPVIASDRVGAAPDLVEGKPYGRVFTSGDMSDLATKLTDLPHDRRALSRLGAMARQDARVHSFDSAAASLMSLIRSYDG